MPRAHAPRCAMERALGALEIGSCGIAAAACGFMLGLENTGILVAIYGVTVAVSYAVVGCLELLPVLTQAGND